MKSNLSLVLLLISFKFIEINSKDLCKSGHIIGGTSFHDEKVKSLVRIVEKKSGGFICRAALIRKHQFITSEYIIYSAQS